MKKRIAAAVLAALCVMLAACGGDAQQKDVADEGQIQSVNGEADSQEMAADAAGAVEMDGEGETQEANQLMEIPTEYGLLFYPAEWEESLETEETNEEGLLSVIFRAKVGEEETALFKVMICGEEGDSVGEITDANQTTRNVFVEVFELADLSALDEAVQNQLYAMQEGVNILIENLE